jgi:hypothetical protein
MTIKLIGLVTGDDHPASGRYVVCYDAEEHRPDGGYDGGYLATTGNPNMAKRFETAEAAWRYWRSGPTCRCHRTRPDGEPNRPLTAFTAEIE